VVYFPNDLFVNLHTKLAVMWRN